MLLQHLNFMNSLMNNRQYLLFLSILFFFNSCITNDYSKNKINVRLGWQVNANSAGQIYALEEGFYKQVGLDVKIEPGGLEVPSIVSVIAGTDQIGFANGPDLVIKAISAGAPLKIIAVIQQESYHGFIVKEESGILNPHQWINKRVAVKYNSPTFLLYQALLNKLNISRDSIDEIPVNYSLNSFIEDNVDVYPGALTNEFISLKQIGLNIIAIKPSDYGIHSLGNVVFTSDKFIEENPLLIKKFIKATQRGWEECLKFENYGKTINALRKYNSEIDSKKEIEALIMNQNLVYPDTIPFIGYINSERLNGFLQILKKFTEIDNDIKIDDIYTQDFLEK